MLCSRITGENVHYGTPTNPSTPHHIPGGSSSGSAVAVAAQLVDFALGMRSFLTILYFVKVSYIIGMMATPCDWCLIKLYALSFDSVLENTIQARN